MKFNDPEVFEEAEKYEHPIASRTAILSRLKELGKPTSGQKLRLSFGFKLKRDCIAFKRRLKAMVRDGQLFKNSHDVYSLATDEALIKGQIMGHKEGYGFCIPEEEGIDDLFLTEYEMKKVFHGDTVLAQRVVKGPRGRSEGSIIEVLQRNTLSIVGRFVEQDNQFIVLPDNKRITHKIMIAKEHREKARTDQMVVVEIIHQPSLKSNPTGKVIEILGQHRGPGVEIETAIRTYHIPHQWSQAVNKETKKYPANVTSQEKVNRLDLRHLPFVTIDGENAKDFDDAVYCERLSHRNYKLYVAIADVSHYVKPGSAIDEEAYERGNSIYFPQQVIPMLPEKLSNQLCSLKPKVDRLCMVSEIVISSKGIIKSYQFHEGVIRSQARLTYTLVNELLTTDNPTVPRSLRQVYPHLRTLYDLFLVLQEQRELRGALDFDTEETRIIFDKKKKIKQIVPLERNDAHRLIEACMLCANVCAADFIQRHGEAALYRNHPKPEADKLTQLKEFLGAVGLQLRGGKNPTPKDYATLLKKAAQRQDATLIQTFVLRSLGSAFYAPDNEGHFGLAFEHYTHFTSPIRRYPDLLVHRIIRNSLHNTKLHVPLLTENWTKVGKHCSATERRADEATRDVTDWLKCEFMLDKIGTSFAGIITTVTNFGLFILLKEIYVEGLLHVSSLKNEYYYFDPVRHQLESKRSGKVFRIGDEIQVKVARVDLENKEIDFSLDTK